MANTISIDPENEKARDQAIRLQVTGMHCASCVGRVESALAQLPGVTSVSVNLAREQAQVIPDKDEPDTDALLEAVRKAGFEASLLSGGHSDRDAMRDQRFHQADEQSQLRRALMMAAMLTLPVFVLEMGAHFIPAFHQWIEATLGRQLNWSLQFVLTTAVLFGPGRLFFHLGLPMLLRLAPDMNSLVALGTSAAWAYSVIATFMPGLLPEGTVNVYYEAAAVIVTLILLGRYLESRARARTSEAISRLLELQPRRARVLRADGVRDIAVEKIEPGELVQVRPGEKIPLDGAVSEGRSWVDESMINGEAMPNRKEPGSKVVGGTINGNGTLTFRVEKIGEDTLLAQIIRLVEQAQASKLPIQRLVDRITLWFVPAVILTALVTLVVWLLWGPAPALSLALVNAVAVLIIACPCAMGLATPVSIMVGTGRAAQQGILFRGGSALQTLRDTRTIALDKTGTLTEGSPRMTDLVPAAGMERDTVLRLIASAEARSEHPIGEAIVRAAEESGIALSECSDFEAIPGYGLRATVEGRRVEIGAGRLLRALEIDPADFPAQARQFADQGKTPLYAVLDGRPAALVAVADTLKPTSKAAIDRLHSQGFTVLMITGDDRRTARAVASQLGIDEVMAEVLPQGKAEAVAALRRDGAKVAYVGDGINDAPALAGADVGIAMGNGTDVAMESADVVLVSGDLMAIPRAVALARATMRNIKQNLFWAFAYNTALIPVAAGALYPAFSVLLSPVLAAAAMALSSIFVLSNALRLRRFRFGEQTA